MTIICKQYLDLLLNSAWLSWLCVQFLYAYFSVIAYACEQESNCYANDIQIRTLVIKPCILVLFLLLKCSGFVYNAISKKYLHRSYFQN